MAVARLIFPHQLFENHPLLGMEGPVYLVEEYLFFRQYRFHKQKIAYHRATMKRFGAWLSKKGTEVCYIPSVEDRSDIRRLIPALREEGFTTIQYVDPTDDWLEKRIRSGAEKFGLALEKFSSPLFMNTAAELSTFFDANKKKFFQTKFYIEQRKKFGILLDDSGKPMGGKWSYDAENRKKYPKGKVPPAVEYPVSNAFYEEAFTYVSTYFDTNPGTLRAEPLYPIDFASSRKWLSHFLQFRFHEFGPFEDAIVAEEGILHHSVLTPMLNVGLLTPGTIIEEALQFADAYHVPINSTEGFIRQIIGWREFIRGMYQFRGVEERTKNFWGFSRKIPNSFYNGTTGIVPVDQTIRKVLQTGYCHHIERLMVLGNFMLLCEFDPNEVYRWFMELFIDAYDWVMVPNVYGMSQFADGGLMATKPYISGSNYIMKMSNYQKGPWQEVWNALFWRFMNVQRDFFTRNPRLGMLVRTFDKMPSEKQLNLMNVADQYLGTLART